MNFSTFDNCCRLLLQMIPKNTLSDHHLNASSGQSHCTGLSSGHGCQNISRRSRNFEKRVNLDLSRKNGFLVIVRLLYLGTQGGFIVYQVDNLSIYILDSLSNFSLYVRTISASLVDLCGSLDSAILSGSV